MTATERSAIEIQDPNEWARRLCANALIPIPIRPNGKYFRGVLPDRETSLAALSDTPLTADEVAGYDYSDGLSITLGTEHPAGGFVLGQDFDGFIDSIKPGPVTALIEHGTGPGKHHAFTLTKDRLVGKVTFYYLDPESDLVVDPDTKERGVLVAEFMGAGYALRSWPSVPENKPQGYTRAFVADAGSLAAPTDTWKETVAVTADILSRVIGREIKFRLEGRAREKRTGSYDPSTRPADPPEAVDRLNGAIEALGSNLGPPARDGWQLGSCPLHSPGRTEGNASFSISYPIGRWHCRSCSPDGGWLDQLAGRLNVSWPAFKPATRPRPVEPNRPLDDGDPGGELFPDGDPVEIDQYGHGIDDNDSYLTDSGKAVIRMKGLVNSAKDSSPDTEPFKNRVLFPNGTLLSDQLPIFLIDDLSQATRTDVLLDLLKSADLDPDSFAIRALSNCGGTKYPACPDHGIRHHKTKHAYCGHTYHAECFSRESWAIARLKLPDLEDGAVYHTTYLEREFRPDPDNRFPDAGDQVQEALQAWSAASGKFASWKGLKGNLMYRSVVFYLFKNRVLARYKLQYREDAVGAMGKQIDKIAANMGATRVAEAATPDGGIALSQGIYDASTHLAYIEDDNFTAFKGYLRETKRMRLFQTYGAYREDLEQEKIESKAEEEEVPDCDVCSKPTKWYAYPPGARPELGSRPPVRPQKQWFRGRRAA